MDRRERINDIEEALRSALDNFQANLWTMMPGIIQSFDAEKLTATVQVSLKIKVRDEEGNVEDVTPPQCLDVPLVFLSGGGYSFTLPVAENDECLLFFASRCIDAWWQSGGIQSQVEFRMHDLSDAFALVGARSQANLLSAFSATKAQMRTDDGTTYVELDKATQKVNIVAPGGVHVTGAITASGEVTSTLGGTHTLTQHKHTGVQTGGGITGLPTG